MNSRNRTGNKRAGKGSSNRNANAAARSDSNRRAAAPTYSASQRQTERGRRISPGSTRNRHQVSEAPSSPRFALCPISRECGACPRIAVPYEQQLAAKQAYVQDLFSDLAGADCRIDAILGMDNPLRFRDKIASPFAPGRALKGHGNASKMRPATRQSRGNTPKRDVLCGMYAAGTHRIVAIDDCPVEHEAGRKVIAAVRRIMLRYGMEAYDEDAGTGFVRHVVVRVGHETGEVLVTIVTNGDAFPGSKNFCRELVKACPQVTTVVQNVNTRDTNAILGQEERVLYGPGFILDTLCGLSFRISSHSFYQVNATQTEALYRTAIDMARAELAIRPVGAECTLMDAYCGTGTIGLVAASLIPGVSVLGVDNVESAIRDARLNARHNGIENAAFVADDAGAYLKRMAAEGARLDVLMMDPPRAGASEEFLQAALALRPEHVVYISCNPATQARDVRILLDGGYHLRRIQPVDMFPHTEHIETVTLLSRAR